MTRLPFLLFFIVLFVACEKQSDVLPSPTAMPLSGQQAMMLLKAAALTTTVEDFETGSKTAYAAANVTLASGVWNFNDALLGNLSTDRKNGTQSARMRNSGTITMQFDITGGATSVTVKHAVFGSDGSSTWQLWYSTNGGASFSQAGSTVTTSSTTLQTASFTLSVTGNVRFQLRKTDGSSNRINFDDFTVNGSGGGSTGGGKKILFDATKAETAGNADWVIDEDGGTPQRTPTPAQSAITASTAETYWTGAISSTNPILHGSQGNVSQLEFNNGATITVNPSANSTVQGLIWQSGFTQNNTHIMCASSTFGTGRVFVVTDSSPMDDGTGAAGNNLFVSWPILSHTQLFMNASLWLAKLQ